MQIVNFFLHFLTSSFINIFIIIISSWIFTNQVLILFTQIDSFSVRRIQIYRRLSFQEQFESIRFVAFLVDEI